jgi:hypothetical protein
VDNIRIEHWENIPFWQTLEHRWRTELIGFGDNLTLYVTAATSAGSDDTFTFGYATALGGPYTALPLTVTSDIMNTYSADLPAFLAGRQVYFRVMDDNEFDLIQQDTLYIDEIRIQATVGMSLDHRWRTQAIDSNTLILEVFVTARTNTGSDDTFSFGYSASLAGPYTPIGITVNSDVMTTYNALVPVLTGVIYVNVFDDNTMDLVQQDTVFVDTVTIEASISSATVTNQVATADNPDHGTVTGTFVLTTSIPPDGAGQQIDEVALSKSHTPNLSTTLMTALMRT